MLSCYDLLNGGFMVQEESETRLGETIEIRGWVRTVRNQKAFSFMEVNI